MDGLFSSPNLVLFAKGVDPPVLRGAEVCLVVPLKFVRPRQECHENVMLKISLSVCEVNGSCMTYRCLYNTLVVNTSSSLTECKYLDT